MGAPVGAREYGGGMQIRGMVIGAVSTVVVVGGVFVGLGIANAQNAPTPTPVVTTAAPVIVVTPTPVDVVPTPAATPIPQSVPIAVPTPEAVVTPQPAAPKPAAPVPVVNQTVPNNTMGTPAPGDIKNAGKITGPTVLPDGSTAIPQPTLADVRPPAPTPAATTQP